jgi:hypothetical protein
MTDVHAQHRPRWSYVVIALILLVVGAFSLDRALRSRYDFHHFYLDARYVWEHRALNPDVTLIRPEDKEADRYRQLPFYLPTVSVIFAPLAAFGRWPAAVLWSLAQVGSLAVCLVVLRDWARHGNPAAPPSAPYVVGLLIALPAFHEAARFNQVSYFVLALVLLGCRRLEGRAGWAAGAWFALAAVLKLLPAIFLPWLLLKRRWGAAATMVAAGLVATLLPPLIAFGPERTVAYHREWLAFNQPTDATRFRHDADAIDHFIDHRNQSIEELLLRYTWDGHPFALDTPLAGTLSEATAAHVAKGITAVLGLALLWFARRPWRELSPLARRCEAATFAIGMLVFAPLVRQYYLVWAVPGLLLLARIAAEDSWRGVRWLGWSGVFVWLVAMIGWIWPGVRLAGGHLALLVVLGGLLLVASYARVVNSNSVISGRQLKRT